MVVVVRRGVSSSSSSEVGIDGAGEGVSFRGGAGVWYDCRGVWSAGPPALPRGNDRGCFLFALNTIRSDKQAGGRVADPDQNPDLFLVGSGKFPSDPDPYPIGTLVM